MFDYPKPKRKPDQDSGLNALAKNAIRLEYKLTDVSKTDEGTFHALASFQLWFSIAKGDLEAVKFYVENGYKSNLICRASKVERGLHELANFFFDVAPTAESKANAENVALYLKNRFYPNYSQSAILEILVYKPEENNVKFSYVSKFGKYSFLEDDEGAFFQKVE